MCLARCWRKPMHPAWTTRSMWPGRTKVPPYCHHEKDFVERAAGSALAGHRAAVLVADDFFAVAFSAGPEDQLCRFEIRCAALHAPGRTERPDRPRSEDTRLNSRH